jgi:hypothetical protein
MELSCCNLPGFILDGFVKNPISALNFIFRQKIFWRRIHRTAGGTPVLWIVAKSSGAARLDRELFMSSSSLPNADIDPWEENADARQPRAPGIDHRCRLLNHHWRRRIIHRRPRGIIVVAIRLWANYDGRSYPVGPMPAVAACL